MAAGLALALWAGALPLYAQPDVTPAQVEALKSRISDINEWLSDAEKDRSELEQQLSGAERRIGELTRERKSLNQQLDQQQKKLDDLDRQQGELSRQLDQQRDSLKQQIRAAWMAGDAPAIKVLLNEVDPDQLARTMTYYEYLSRDNVAQLQAYQSTLRKLRDTQQQVLATQQQLTDTEQTLADRQQQLDASRKQRAQALAALKNDIRSKQSERDRLEADRKRLEKLLNQVQEAIANIPTPNESSPFRSLRHKLPWPVKGKVISRYGESYADGKLRRTGLLISTAESAPVKAVHYGRVVFANWLRGFGLLTIIDHGDGYLSLYGHSSSLFTSPGDWVSAGQTIAEAGQTGGAASPELYFEIRHNGKPTNPLGWLAR